MQVVYFLSNSIKGFDLAKVTSSSEKYVLNLALCLSKHVNVIILTNRLNYLEKIERGNLQLLGTKTNNKSENKCIKEILKKETRKCSVVFWGYKLSTVLCLLRVKKFNKQIYAFIFDSHKTVLKNYSPLWKKIIIDSIFSCGRSFVRFLDGFIFFQEIAIKRLKIKNKPVLVTKPGVNPYCIQRKIKNNIFTASFCGTFTELNGIDKLLQAIKNFPEEEIQFFFVGDGPLLSQVEELALNKANVKYIERSDANQVDSIYECSDLLFNLRDLNDEAMNFAFPSKTFECASMAIPMITTKLLDDNVFINNAVIIDNVTVEEITKAIEKVVKNYQIYKDKSMLLKKYIDERYSFDNCALELYDFLKQNN